MEPSSTPKRGFLPARNMTRAGSAFRILAGLAILALGLIYGSWWGLIGLAPLGFGLSGWCPLYSMFGRKGAGPGPQEG